MGMGQIRKLLTVINKDRLPRSDQVNKSNSQNLVEIFKTRLYGVICKTLNGSYHSLYEKRGGSSAGCRNRIDSKSILSEPIHHEELTHSS